jgi:hypothetical protein
MTERRFDDDEVARIFARATETQRDQSRALARQDGMTLAELQAIGKEAGIDPALVAQAAREVDQPAPPKTPTVIGIPIGVARTVELGRRLSDDEWERLVVRCRDLFNARGKLESHGNFRSWTNGNLQILLEPGATGHRLRMRTLRGESRGLVAAGASMVLAASVVSFAGSLTSAMSLVEIVASSLPIFLGGVGMGVAGVARLPQWRRERDAQFQRLADEVLALTDGR